MITLCDNVAHKGCRRIKDKPRRERQTQRKRQRPRQCAEVGAAACHNKL